MNIIAISECLASSINGIWFNVLFKYGLLWEKENMREVESNYRWCLNFTTINFHVPFYWYPFWYRKVKKNSFLMNWLHVCLSYVFILEFVHLVYINYWFWLLERSVLVPRLALPTIKKSLHPFQLVCMSVMY